MSAIASHQCDQTRRRPRGEPWGALIFIGTALAVLSLLILLPLITVFAEALRRGWELFPR
jgi:sulfate transport system permease protein